MDPGVARSRARNAAIAVGVLLAASVLVLLFREALFTDDGWAWAYVALDVLAVALVGLLFWRASRPADEHGPAPLNGAYSIAGIGVIGALAEFGDQLFG
jgi:hypothetical protein